MDYSPKVAQPRGTLTWFIPVALLIDLLKPPWAKDQISELLMHLFTHWQLGKPIHRRLHLADRPRFSLPRGFFVLETKNMNVCIFDSEKQAQWIQTLCKHNVKLQNSPHQNCTPPKTLDTVLVSTPGTCTQSITFVGSTCKTEMLTGKSRNIGFIRYISLLCNRCSTILKRVRTEKTATTHILPTITTDTKKCKS